MLALMRKQRKYLIFSTYPLTILLIWWARKNPEQLELFFGKGFYQFSKTIRDWVFDLLPFSFGDFFYSFLVLGLFFLIASLVKNWKKGLYQLFASIGMLLLWFHISWGLNYYRPSVYNVQNINYTEDELIETSKRLIEEANLLHEKLSVNKNAAVVIQDTTKELIKQLTKPLNETTFNATVKQSLFSTPLSYMGFSGYLNPFTLEAHINSTLPKISLPITIAHEMAHQNGIASENDANFMGFKQCYTHTDNQIRYAALLFAYQKCYGALYILRPEKAVELNGDLNPGILENYKEIYTFWLDHQNPLEPYFKSSYDRYLKANNQSAGILSYDQVVGQIIGYFKAK